MILTCKHKPIQLCYDIYRLSELIGGPATVFELRGNAFCCDCKQEYQMFRVNLKPVPISGAAILAHPCDHKDFRCNVRVDYSRDAVKSECKPVVTAFVRCDNCGMLFEPVAFNLLEKEEDAGLYIPTDEELEKFQKQAGEVKN